jgi:hypothetical protein
MGVKNPIFMRHISPIYHIAPMKRWQFAWRVLLQGVLQIKITPGEEGHALTKSRIHSLNERRLDGGAFVPFDELANLLIFSSGMK